MADGVYVEWEPKMAVEWNGLEAEVRLDWNEDEVGNCGVANGVLSTLWGCLEY